MHLGSGDFVVAAGSTKSGFLLCLFCFKSETFNLQLQHVTLMFFTGEQRFSFVIAHCARMTHTNCNLKRDMFCQPSTEFYIRVASSFQVSASKGREGGSTYLVACFLFLCHGGEMLRRQVHKVK